MTENKHFLQLRGVGSVEKNRMSIPPPIATVVLHQSLHNHDSQQPREKYASKPTHFLFARQRPSSHLLY
jgi:hypothetical protein